MTDANYFNIRIFNQKNELYMKEEIRSGKYDYLISHRALTYTFKTSVSFYLFYYSRNNTQEKSKLFYKHSSFLLHSWWHYLFIQYYLFTLSIDRNRHWHIYVTEIENLSTKFHIFHKCSNSIMSVLLLNDFGKLVYSCAIIWWYRSSST